MIERETIGGIPLGLSRDFAHLPPIGISRSAQCPHCLQPYEEIWRRMEDGARCCLGMCEACREEGRARWIAATRSEVPIAVATYRGGLR